MSVHSPTRFSEGGTWTNDGSLPPQWEELVDPETGKRYFVDHALKITSWVDPRDLFMKPEKFEECADGGFALGWERAVDPIDGEYFINHNTWTTTLKDPRLPPADRTRLPIQAHDLMDESIGPLSARTSVYHEQDEMFEKMSEYISQNEGRSRRLQDRVEELEDELQTTNRHSVDAGGSGEKARIKQLEAQVKSMRAKVQSDIDASTESFMSKQKADARFRQQQQEIEELRAMMKDANGSRSSNQVWDDSLQSVVALNGTTVLSKTNVGMLDRKPPADGVKRRERRSSSTRRRLSRYNSESGASDFEYEIMTAEMDRLEDMMRSHETRIGQLRVRSASNSGGTSTKAKLLAAAGNLGNTVGGLTDADTMSVVSSDSQALTAAREAARKKHTLSPTAQKLRPR